MNVNESLQYAEVHPYLHACSVATYSAQRQLSLLTQRLTYQASTGQLLRADVVRIRSAIESANVHLQKADSAIAALVSIVQEETM